MITPERIVIVGGGFGGVQTALALDRARRPSQEIILLAPEPHFTYTSALYRVVTGRSPLEVCIPLREIFAGTAVQIVEDGLKTADFRRQAVVGRSGATHHYDTLVIAVGSETDFRGIPGLATRAFGFKTIREALALKRHLHELFEANRSEPPRDQVTAAHLVIVGGGPTGVELAGELAMYARQLAVEHGLDPSLVTIDLIEAGARIVGMFPPDISQVVERRLRELGVNIYLHREVIREEVTEILLRDMEMKTKTVIWTAGVKPNRILAGLAGVKRDKKSRIIVDEHRRLPNHPNVFVIGDAAATQYSGMAQTAIHDADIVANAIGLGSRHLSSELRNQHLTSVSASQDHRPIYAIPVGPGWAMVLWGSVRIYGILGWWLRRLADLRYFLSILPLPKALVVWRSGQQLCESCPVCLPEDLTERT